MSKYEEFQQLFVEAGDFHLEQSDACFEAIDQLSRQLIEYADWHPDDLEYISLGHPILPGKPKEVIRFKRSGRNRDRIRDIATWVNDVWSLGIRLRLRPHLNVAFQPREVMFVLPILVTNSGEGEITVQIEPEGTVYTPEQFESLVELVFQRIQVILEQGVQRLFGKSHRPEELADLGFVLNSESLEDLGIETDGRPAIQPAKPVEAAAESPSTPMPENVAPTMATRSPEPSPPTSTAHTAKRSGRSRKSK